MVRRVPLLPSSPLRAQIAGSPKLAPVTTTPSSGRGSAQAATMRSLERALQVFEGLQHSEGAQRLSEIASRHAMSAATVLRILRVLKEHGLVSQTSAGYRVGAASLPPAQQYLHSDPLPVLGIPVLDELARTTHVTASLYTRSGDERILVARSDGQHPLRYTLPFGVRLPLTRGAAGKVLLFGLPEEELRDVLDAAVTAGHEAAGTGLPDLLARLGDQTAGFASSKDERATGVISVAVSIPP